MIDNEDLLSMNTRQGNLDTRRFTGDQWLKRQKYIYILLLIIFMENSYIKMALL